MTLVTAPQDVFGADTFGLLLRGQCRQNTVPKPDGTKVNTAEKSKKSAHREGLSLDNRCPHKGRVAGSRRGCPCRPPSPMTLRQAQGWRALGVAGPRESARQREAHRCVPGAAWTRL